MEKKPHQRQSISLETKITILDRLGKGEGSTAIGKKFNLGESTVRAIKKNEAAIRKSVISGTKLSTKFATYTRGVLLERTERAIAIWIEEQVQRRIPSATADEGAAKIFPEELAKNIEDGDYSAGQVFNADETGLYWKKLPNRTYIAKDEKTASGHKASKDRVTLLLCSNASGDRMLKPLLINKSLRPRALKEWFNNCFVPEVEAYVKEKSLDFKVLLIVDNAASHPQLEHPNVQVFLPRNTTSLIQPLDQGKFATFKKYYIKTTHKFILNKLENESLTPACATDNTTTQTSTLSDEIINFAHEIGGDGFNTFSHDDIGELLVDDALSHNDIIDLTLDLTVDGVVGLEESSSQSLITDYIVRKGRATQNEKEVCENPWPLPQISIADKVSSDDEGDLEPLRKRCKTLSHSDND
ncbi:tigger transposable element-derived protein 1 [Trichonephila clavipes]|nr:tigger transposable element-derived protein 1 [Trichonephila clavipes]